MCYFLIRYCFIFYFINYNHIILSEKHIELFIFIFEKS